ncbi:hypothetical protein [Agromyces salentinus]|uniref:Uncharacterized protein n=1 Tax=Agromyces salentinus TaxID=269421 RepID=A0ABP4YNQ5_9MICO|nr:hypothetical protein [Agromyces salentinus]
MRRILDLRIVRWEFKVLYIVLAWIAGFVVLEVVRSTGAPVIVIALVNVLTTFAPFVLAVRIFRGADEPVVPPRHWWRMTAWPTLSRRLGVLFTVLAALGAIGLVVAVAGWAPGGAERLVPSAEVTATSGVLAYLYLNSAVRMRRTGIVKPVPIRPVTKLKL